jgi:YVTN family beta-propeller protein
LLVITSSTQGQVSSRHLYVSNERSRDVSVIDAATNKVIARIPMPARPRGIQASPDGRRIYVAVSDDSPSSTGSLDGIIAIDAATRKVLRTMSAGSDPEQFAVSRDGRTLYASNEDAGTMSAIDVATGRVRN